MLSKNVYRLQTKMIYFSIKQMINLSFNVKLYCIITFFPKFIINHTHNYKYFYNKVVKGMIYQFCSIKFATSNICVVRKITSCSTMVQTFLFFYLN